jgi:hypothetical protein
MNEKMKNVFSKVKGNACNFYGKSCAYVKDNYKNKCFLVKCAIGFLALALVVCFISCNKQTVTYHYVGTSYIKETREGSDVVKRELCFIDKDKTTHTSKYLTYFCSKELIEYSNK